MATFSFEFMITLLFELMETLSIGPKLRSQMDFSYPYSCNK